MGEFSDLEELATDLNAEMTHTKKGAAAKRNGTKGMKECLERGRIRSYIKGAKRNSKRADAGLRKFD